MVGSLMLLAVLCTACVRMPPRELQWPETLPPIQYFERVYQQDKGNQAVQSRRNYLTWVIRFYQGWDLYPDGWGSTSRDVVLGVDEEAKKKRLEEKLARLGRLISAEWAKNSDDRVIRSRLLSVWGQALLKSINHDEEEQLVDRVTRDVNALLARQIDPSDISLKRYYKTADDVYTFD